MSEAAIDVPHRPPYTVDDLFEMPDDGNRYEVFGGSLLVSPAPAPIHQLVTDELRLIFRLALPRGVLALTGLAIRTPEDDGPIPDIVVTTADVRAIPGALPHHFVYTVVEVVSPRSRLMDRSYKPELYAEAGIPCYWRVELKPSHAYRGPFPLIVVQLRDGGVDRTIEAAPGQVARLPVAIGRGADGAAETITVEIDPSVLIDA
jgi:Uma2 family endonuclease